MLLKIDGKNENPTQTLILALQSRGSKMTKEEDFYMAFMDGDVRLRLLQWSSELINRKSGRWSRSYRVILVVEL